MQREETLNKNTIVSISRDGYDTTRAGNKSENKWDYSKLISKEKNNPKESKGDL